ncbi:Putative wing apart-like protein [Septoria linicola]|uniref:Wing apart-like protein n=1 Tax=Septoria linicola TaxID=215465 RepID=A0A9Q9EJW0_9PEZI|nr:Putative wing apart-like protein [Septoria linicola]
MAAVSTITHSRRRKQTTYGKASRSASTWNVKGFSDDEDDLASVANVVRHPEVIVERIKSPVKAASPELPRGTVKESYRVEKRAQKKIRSPKQAKIKEKKLDEWDVPSSDDEVGNSFRRRSPLKIISRRNVVSVVEEQEVSLAPWERRKQPSALDQASDRSETELQASLDKQLQEDDIVLNDSAYTSPEARSPGTLVSPGGGSAAERLKARRTKRTEGDSTDLNPKPRKRVKAANDDKQRQDQKMQDAQAPICEERDAEAPPKMDEEDDIYTFRESIEAGKPRPTAAMRRRMQQVARYGKLPTVARSSPRTMTSAPARLTEMLPDDTDTTEDTTRSPSVSLSRPSTPGRPASAGKTATPETARKTSLTPRQDRMWQELLQEDETTATPSGLPMQGLTLHSNRCALMERTAPSRMLTKSSSDLGPPRQRDRLVDRLKASAPDSDTETTDSEHIESDTEDASMGSDDPMTEESGTSQSQSYSQSTVVLESGPKHTYSRVRSYLPEDSFEDGLMLSLPDAPPKAISRTSSKPKTNSQRSTLDLPESDGEDDGRALRTVHDLRAAGGNQRFMDETASLLEDIASRDTSTRSRRRSALIELTKKLMDSKAFVEKFFRQGFERHVIAELQAPSDDIADFVLIAASATLLSDESPDHVAQSFRDGSAVPWLVQRVHSESDPMMMARDRKNNMSKAAQLTFVEFVGKLSANKALWGDLEPTLISPRTLALKVLDSLVGKLRRSGDRSELVDRHEVQELLFSESSLAEIRHDEIPADLTLSVSVLERLAALGAPVPWPVDVVQRIGQLLVKPVLTGAKLKHLRFLALRLCLSLTNDNIKGCKQLAKLPVVHSLFSTISSGFKGLASQLQDIELDLLVLEMGVIVNLTEHAERARASAVSTETAPLLVELVTAFNIGQKRLLDAETEEETAANVAYGHLAVVLAILCRNRDAKQLIAANLPRKNLGNLIDAVEEFIGHHRKVDRLAFGGEEGGEVWSAFTEKLKEVLDRLKAVAEDD